MSTKKLFTIKPITIGECFDDFILAKQSILVSDGTVELYELTIGKFLAFMHNQEIVDPQDITNKLVREFIVSISTKNYSGNYLYTICRNVKTFLKFCFAENYMNNIIKIAMPHVEIKRLTFLQPDDLNLVLAFCKRRIEKAVILLMVDSGLRLSEVCNLKYSDIDLNTGVIIVKHGKGNKSRVATIGIKTRRTLLAYSRTIDHSNNMPLFQVGKTGKAYQPGGLFTLIHRISKQCGIEFSPHSLRRTFATMALKSGMNLTSIQGILGHVNLEMTRHYIQLLDPDYIEQGIKYSPVDHFLK